MNREKILSDSLFKKIIEIFYKKTGINLTKKKYLVEHRLSKFLGKKFDNYEEFYTKLLNDKCGEYTNLLIQSLTTNWTLFFRENIHFDFLKNYLKYIIQKENIIRLWSAACSTGEEAYTMAITVSETIPVLEKIDLKILATDISLPVLNFAIKGEYHFSKIKGGIDDKLLKKYFIFDKENKSFIVKENLKNLVYFRYLNLMDNYPFQKEFDVVFLRNILIYFDREEKEFIINKIYNVIKKNGYLILGLSESLVGIKNNFFGIKNSIYQKK